MELVEKAQIVDESIQKLKDLFNTQLKMRASMAKMGERDEDGLMQLRAFILQ